MSVEPQSIAEPAAGQPPELQGIPGRPCKLCAAPLVFLSNIETGKPIPIDARAPVYALFRDANNRHWVRPAKAMLWELQHAPPEAAAALLQGVDGFRASHFSTCRSPDSFNKEAKAREAAREVHRLRLVEACETAAAWVGEHMASGLMPGDADLVRQSLLAAAGNREPGEDEGMEDQLCP